ncbi:MAG TPA: isochorismatase family protein [Candidatus Binatia bacterium]|jgi:nicotinamidase-related amidase
MARAQTIVVLFVLLLSAQLFAQEGPHRPEAKPVTLDAKTTAVLVLDLNARCHDAKQICNKLTPRLGEFLEKVRAANVLIVYSVSASAKGTPLGEVATPLKRRDNEPIVYPDAFDKFTGGELQTLLKDKGIKTLVITGASTNAAVLYTATTAARMYRYTVVVPMDGMVANSNYEQEYTFHQFTVLPSDTGKQFQFTKLEMVGFK